MAIEHDLKPFEARGRDKERAFTNEYVVSVFQRLGFSVVYNHGQRERGRDLILGFLDGLAHFVYSGLQVKFEPSIGIGADSRDLANDARQAFTHPFTHPQTGDEY